MSWKEKTILRILLTVAMFIAKIDNKEDWKREIEVLRTHIGVHEDPKTV